MSSSDEEGGRPMMVAETGLPHLSSSAKSKAFNKSALMLPVTVLMPRALGLGIAYLIYRLDVARYDARVAFLDPRVTDGTTSHSVLRIGYLFLAAGIFSVMVTLLNTIPTVFKSQVMPGNAGNLRSNMQILKVNYVDAGHRLPYVVMEEDGEIGEYNRANRALLHFVENSLGLVLNILLAGTVFSEAVLTLVCLYVLARIWYQVAYAEGGYGLGICKHGIPFAVHSILVKPVFEMLVWLVGVLMVNKYTKT